MGTRECVDRRAAAQQSVAPDKRFNVFSLRSLYFIRLQLNANGRPLACPACHGAMRIVAFITQASVIDKILTHRRSRATREARRRAAESPIDAGLREPERNTHGARRRRYDGPLSTAQTLRRHAGTPGARDGPGGASYRPRSPGGPRRSSRDRRSRQIVNRPRLNFLL